MDFQKMIDSMNKMTEMSRSKYHLTLGDLIEVIGKVPPGTPIKFDDGSNPGEFDSYRGYYSDLSIQPQSQSVTSDELLASASAALGETFTGYKGGDFTMHKDTPLWKAAYGCCGPAIVDGKMIGDTFVLITKEVD